jgi:membrane-bound lytic murein transglycosylase MltF
MKKKLLLSLFTLTLGLASLQANTEDAKYLKKLESAKTQSKPLVKRVLKKYTGDLDEMLKRKTIRILVVNSKAFYGIEKGKSTGIYNDAIVAFEKQINKNYPNANKHIKTKLVPIPVTRAMLIPALNAGYGDVAIADNTITKRREEQIAFSDPFASGINEILVTNSTLTGIEAFEDLSGKEVYVKPSMSYLDSLLQVSETLVHKGLDPIVIRSLPEELESEDILELVNDGLIGITIMDDYKAKMWSTVYKKLTLHEDITFRENAELAVMVRKNNPQLLEELNSLIQTKGVGDAFAKVATKKYFESKHYKKLSKSGISKKKFQSLKKTFQKYAEQYELDPLMLMAQAYQESRLKEKARSHAGARGIMQLMPATAREMNVGSIYNTDANIHAGIKYHKKLKEHYFNDENIAKEDRSLFIFAGYNAGPNRINKFRKMAKERGLDSNKWFGNVELIAAEKIGRETVQYIQNIYNYYIAYTMMNIQNEAKLRAKIALFYDVKNIHNSELSKKEKEIKQELALLVGTNVDSTKIYTE